MGLSTFYGLNLGLSTLEAMKQAQSVVGNNMANASTPGYVRERSVMQEQVALTTTGNAGVAGRVGQGVTVESIQRVTNQFVNRQDRANQSNYQMYNVWQQNLSQIQSILNEPSSNSMQNAVDQFFQSWQTLSTNPTDTAARQSVISEAQTLGQTFQTITGQLEAMQSNLGQTVTKQVGQFNQYAQEVANLNKQIVSVKNQGQSPNALQDQRGLLLDKMSQLADVTYQQQNDGSVSVSVGSNKTQVVSGSSFTQLSTSGLVPGTLVQNGSSAAAPYPSSGFNLSQIKSGSIAGNVHSLDDASKLLGNLDSFLKAFQSQVNQVQHNKNAYDLNGNNLAPVLFTSTVTASGNTVLHVNNAFLQQGGTDLLAASSTGQPGDNGNALNMLQLQNAVSHTSGWNTSYASLFNNTTLTTGFNGNGTFDQFIGSTVSQIGVEASGVNSEVKTAGALAQQSANLRQSISGVNQDAQAAKMIQYQNTYNAAAKFISVFNQMLQTLITNV
ncbi:flagellar hook-associated protein FlgK [Alicyclobacillus sp. SO9]|uniref:flagellar hook-associated protein FlgK n=1 Tax=Alicyclobacillus sp. SO9 TaxID=2665646 RepID=UPI0018E71646|nr:flagellar hook-associated protein FlgK [Alicyclobacillus sp. SO9]QQE78116.1 flagellar hook-associated protein FlgK [Alicyclobacillus sp. SO9]